MRGKGIQQLLLQKAKSGSVMLHLHSLLSSSTISPFSCSSCSRSTAAMSSDAAPTSISDQKRALRSKMRSDLKAFSPAQRAEEDMAIQNNVLDSSWFKSASRLCAYISCEALREVDTSRILLKILKNQDADCHTQVNKKVYVPRVEDKNSHMRMLNITSMEDLVANSMNILEPSSVDASGNQLEDVMLANDPVDILLLPGLAFDRQGGRLGRGGGYYDVFLQKYKELATERKWKQPLLIALAYSLQIVDEGAIPMTPTDVPIDALVSPSGVIPISSAAMEKMCDSDKLSRNGEDVIRL